MNRPTNDRRPTSLLTPHPPRLATPRGPLPIRESGPTPVRDQHSRRKRTNLLASDLPVLNQKPTSARFKTKILLTRSIKSRPDTYVIILPPSTSHADHSSLAAAEGYVRHELWPSGPAINGAIPAEVTFNSPKPARLLPGTVILRLPRAVQTLNFEDKIVNNVFR